MMVLLTKVIPGCIIMAACVLCGVAEGTVSSLRGNSDILTEANVGEYQFETKWFQQTLDHFSYSSWTFPQKYLINDTWWDRENNGPIFFYSGNEGNIELFAQNTGFMWDIAPEFGALLVFAEHRYYGKSLPFGKETWSNLTSDRLDYLSSEQALADYAVLLNSLKGNLSTSAPVVTFGGSYGGMLSAWFRQKYPSTVVGAISASAPVLQFPGITGPKVFNHIITQDFEEATPGSSKQIYNSWQVMEKWAENQSTRDQLQQMMQICSSLNRKEDVTSTLFNWLSSAYSYLAMADYPYPASFLGPMPGNPINVTAKFWDFSSSATDEELIEATYRTANLFYNYTGQAGACFNIKQVNPPGLQNEGWPYQSCTEMVMPIGQYGLPSDMFFKAPWDYDATVKQCQQQFHVTPRPHWIEINYGGTDVSGASNIVYSNGNRDPWSGGGFTSNSSLPDSVIAVYIEGGAHHLDLRSSNPDDPESVIVARNIHRHHIRQWIGQE